ncbi:MAG: Ribonuclease H [Microgenomates group bacterium GW2011_GWA2_47_8]|nr:MAG: Ribonuclease H [Microgenomates group bacterium GW2011_GWA2_47_8]
MNYIIHTDGGARGNPGPAAVGVVIESEKTLITEFGKRIGETTNNVAEYTAVIEALKKVESLKSKVEREIHFFLDSNLVVQQLNGKFKVKDGKLRELLIAVRMLEQEVGGKVSYGYVPREQNQRADFLVNKALDVPPHVSFL